MSRGKSATLKGSCLRAWQEPLGNMEKTLLPMRIMVPIDALTWREHWTS